MLLNNVDRPSTKKPSANSAKTAVPKVSGSTTLLIANVSVVGPAVVSGNSSAVNGMRIDGGGIVSVTVVRATPTARPAHSANTSNAKPPTATTACESNNRVREIG